MPAFTQISFPVPAELPHTIQLSSSIESPPNSKVTPPSVPASFPTTVQFTNRVAPFGLYTPYLPKDLLPEKIQFIKVELLVPVAKCNAPPFELELEFASFPRNWIPEKEITLPAEETAPPKFDELLKKVL